MKAKEEKIVKHKNAFPNPPESFADIRKMNYK